MTPQDILAAIGFAVCVALLLRQMLGERRRMRLDAALRRAGWRLRGTWQRRRPRSKAAPTTEQDARQEAERLIEQARRGRGSPPPTTEPGHVIRPGRFGGRRNDLH